MKHIVVVYEIGDDETFLEAKATRVVYRGGPSGIRVRQLGTGEEAFIRYARWFDKESTCWNGPNFEEYNWLFLRSQENWANDMLRTRGYLFLNEIQAMLGLSHTAMGAVVGWVYEEGVKVNFGCWEQEETPLREGAILLDFNVQGPILQAHA